MRVYIEFNMENWDEFKSLVEYLMGNDSKYELHTLGTLEITQEGEQEMNDRENCDFEIGLEEHRRKEVIHGDEFDTVTDEMKARILILEAEVKDTS